MNAIAAPLDLSPFVDRREERKPLRHPWISGDRIVATNGKVLVSVPKDTPVMQELKIWVGVKFVANADRFLDEARERAVGGKIKPMKVNPRGLEMEFKRTIRGVIFKTMYLEPVAALPDLKFYVDKSNRYLAQYFTFALGEGILMPCRPVLEDES